MLAEQHPNAEVRAVPIPSRRVTGLMMPCRWDIDRNAPREEEPKEVAADDPEGGDER